VSVNLETAMAWPQSLTAVELDDELKKKTSAVETTHARLEELREQLLTASATVNGTKTHIAKAKADHAQQARGGGARDLQLAKNRIESDSAACQQHDAIILSLESRRVALEQRVAACRDQRAVLQKVAGCRPEACSSLEGRVELQALWQQRALKEAKLRLEEKTQDARRQEEAALQALIALSGAYLLLSDPLQGEPTTTYCVGTYSMR